MSEFTLTQTGVRELAIGLDGAAGRTQETIQAMLWYLAAYLEQAIETRTPIDTGHLRRNLFSEVIGSRAFIGFHPVGYELKVEAGVKGRVMTYHRGTNVIWTGVGAQMVGRTVADPQVKARVDGIIESYIERFTGVATG